MTTEFTLGGASPDAPTQEMHTNGEAPGSLVSQLREAARAQQEEHTEEFMVGGEFRKQLWIRHKPLDPGPMDKFIARRSQIQSTLQATKGDLPVTELNMDLMAQSCVAVLGADVNGENREVLTDDAGNPFRLDYRLLEFLHIPLPPEGQPRPTARDVIMILFGRNGMAIVNYGDDLLGWMQDPANVKDQEPGES